MAEGADNRAVLGASLGLPGHIERIARHYGLARSRALAEEGLTPRDVEVLNALGRAGSPYQLSLGELARAAQLSSGGMTSQADRMEQAGWVERIRDPHDRRGVLMSLTETGRQVLERSLEIYLRGAGASIDGLDAAEQHTLKSLLGKLSAAIEAESSPRRPARKDGE